MIKSLKKTLSGLAVMMLSAAGAFSASAQTQAPIITFHTQVYDNAGATNVFSMAIGATKDTYIEVDYGFGPVEQEIGQAIFDSSSQTIQATRFSGSVSEEGIVKIYGDASIIDYLDLEGAYVDKLDITALKNVEILDLRHNQLQELDLSSFKKLQVLYMEDNPFDETPFVLGPDHPDLYLLDVQNIHSIDQTMTISDYPKLVAFQAYHCVDLRFLDPTNCPELQIISIDCTNVEKLDVSKNPKLKILNIGETKINSLDLSNNKELTQLYCDHSGSMNSDNKYKFTSIDISNNPNLQYFFAGANLLESIDVSNNPYLTDISIHNNLLTDIDISNNQSLLNLNLNNNYFTFATLPADRASFLYYQYYQKPMRIDRSFKVGTELDFSKTMLRDDSETYAALMSPNPYDPNEMLDLGEEYYDFNPETGIFKLKKEVTDSVYIAFHNTLLSSWDLRTASFVVKSEEDFGKPNQSVSLRLAPTFKGEVALSVGIKGASETDPKEFFVDFGDGELVSFTTTSEDLPSSVNATGSKKKVGNMGIYVPEGEDLTALAIDGMRLSSLNVDASPMLTYLSVTGCDLPSISLKKNRVMRYLNLNDNALTYLDVSGDAYNMEKNLLHEIYANNNMIETFNGNANGVARVIELSHNNLSEFPMKQQKSLRYLDLSYNNISEVNLESSEYLETLNMEGNELSQFLIPQFTPLESLNLSYNRIPFSAMPLENGIEEFIYAPQKEWKIAEEAPVINLSPQYTEVNGNATEFKWYSAVDDQPVADGLIFKNTVSSFRFSDSAEGEYYAVMTNAAFPDLSGEYAYRTTTVKPKAAPKDVVATFTPVNSGTAMLIMTATKGMSDAYVYVDWDDTGNLDQLHLIDKTYTNFYGNVKSKTEVKVYSYLNGDDIAVFSIEGGALKSVDVSCLKSVHSFGLYDSEIEEENVKLPENPNLTSLQISKAKFKSSSFPQYPNLTNLVMMECELTSFDGTIYPELERFVGPYNFITETKFNNPKMWELVLIGNGMPSIDLTGAENVTQLLLDNNRLSSINVDNLRKLVVLKLTQNDFSFVTLPRQKSTWGVYEYSMQSPMKAECIDGVVDLSSQLTVGSYITSYQWFHDTPWVDEYNELQGDRLEEGVDYTISDGVTTFLKANKNVMCVMLNAAFPNLIYYTYFLDVEPSGVDSVSESVFNIVAGDGMISVTADAAAEVSVFATDGRLAGNGMTDSEGHLTIDGLSYGIYVVNVSGHALKVLVK